MSLLERRSLRALTVAAMACGFAAAAPVASAHPSGHGHHGHGAGLRLVPLSARADLVSGEDVLVRLEAPRGALDRVRVTRNGRDVTRTFRPDADGRSLTGLVTELQPGPNRLAASLGHGRRATLRVRDHRIQGPTLSVPQEQPFVCTTDRFELVDGSTLGAPLDANCSAGTRIDYAYRSTDGSVKPLADPSTRPADLVHTTTIDGRTVPFLIRIETGTINRAIYQIAVLHDPADPQPTFARHSRGWNGRLIYTFGGGCRGGWYSQGEDTGGVLDPEMLRRGYAVASASLNVFGNNCNDLIAAETTSMVKEHFIEHYGVPRFTIGWGCSGGSYQSHQIADNYPGLLDGIVVGCSFPDVTSATDFKLFDSRLLLHYFEDTAPGEFTPQQQRQVSGMAVVADIPNMSDGAKRLDPTAEFPDVVPPELRYDPVTNPHGARGDVYDHTVNVYGHDPATGFAARPLDNVGVQYGLAALNAGTITKAQFLDLNARIGGLDLDARPTLQRTIADRGATRAAYGTGRILSGGGGLATTPIIDYRAYTDTQPGGDIHQIVHGFSTRARLIRENGNADNQVMLVEDFRYGYFSLESPVLREALTQMEQWLTAITGERSHASLRSKVVRDKPTQLTDACWTPDAQQRKIVQRLSVDNRGPCGRLFPAYSTPRLAAGEPLTDDVVKCRRKPIDATDYRMTFTRDERRQLREIFPQGVCDWSRRGVAQRGLYGTWLSVHGRPHGPGRVRRER